MNTVNTMYNERTTVITTETDALEAQNKAIQDQLNAAFKERPESIHIVWLSDIDIDFTKYTEPEILLLYRGAKWYLELAHDVKNEKKHNAAIQLTELVDNSIATLEQSAERREVSYAQVMRTEYCLPTMYPNEKLETTCLSRTSYNRYKTDGLTVLCELIHKTRDFLRKANKNGSYI